MQIPLSTGDPAALAEVGGKAASLIRLRQAGFNVPDGFVLCTTFFAPWIREVESGPAWQSVLAALGDIRSTHPTRDERERLERTCGQARDFAASLPLGSEQRAALDQARARLGGGSYAVRSSSPEEDLAGASFAGLYETVLNVAPDGLLPAVRECFRSCLDARVLLYKREMGFDDPSPAIAVIVQCQVASETAGVAFSLNPGTNDFDEVLINASWGLGEALVSGETSPDAIVVDNSPARSSSGAAATRAASARTRIVSTRRGSRNSPGIARGPVKVLNDPFEKDVAPGDVLVAVTTDPGWTPLFINAAAVLLEIGGELQHGALVARAYGKPCVVGVPAITARLQDGQLVEVNGDVGRVQILSETGGDSRH